MDLAGEMEQEPFNVNEFVERLAWGVLNSNGSLKSEAPAALDAQAMLDTFEETIRNLQVLKLRAAKKCERLENMAREEENLHWKRIMGLEGQNMEAVETFHELDSRINSVATKVVYLGDQLESVNTPRSRAVEAQKLLTHFAGFLKSGPVLSPLFTDKSKLYEAADVIQKLHLVSQELPSNKFSFAQKQISQKYDEIERSLIEEFVRAQLNKDIPRMKEIASILSVFKGYSQCVDAYIEQSQMGAFLSGDVFADVAPLCERNWIVMKHVFTNPEQVMRKFVLNIYHGKLKEFIVSRLADRSKPDRYLRSLHDLYARTTKLSLELSRFDMGSDQSFLSKIVQTIFQKYLDSYISVETRCLKEKYAAILQRFYESKNHQKKPLNTGGIQELRRDLQAVITAKTGVSWDTYNGEVLLSEQIAVTLLDEAKQALLRCQSLSKSSDAASNAVEVFDVVVHALINDFVDYAIEIALQGIPPVESRAQPEIYFFNVCREVNAITHLLEKLFHDNLLPLVVSTPKHRGSLQKKKIILEQLEVKLDAGIDRSIGAIAGWAKVTLQAEQKKSDFRPESEDGVVVVASPVCVKVCRFVSAQAEKIRAALDGKNLEAVLTELGVRFHRVIYEHLQQFQYNSIGALCAICDVNEYRKCVQDFKIPVVATLFDTLHALCNLLLELPEKLRQVSTGDQLAGLDRSVIANFIQLRADYKTAKLGNLMKTLTVELPK